MTPTTEDIIILVAGGLAVALSAGLAVAILIGGTNGKRK